MLGQLPGVCCWSLSPCSRGSSGSGPRGWSPVPCSWTYTSFRETRGNHKILIKIKWMNRPNYSVGFWSSCILKSWIRNCCARNLLIWNWECQGISIAQTCNQSKYLKKLGYLIHFKNSNSCGWRKEGNLCISRSPKAWFLLSLNVASSTRSSCQVLSCKWVE